MSAAQDSNDSLYLSQRIDLIRMIVQRLERLSADSRWAHISSGYRGSMIKLLGQIEGKSQVNQEERELIEFLIGKGLELLANAAREMGDPSLISGLPQK